MIRFYNIPNKKKTIYNHQFGIPENTVIGFDLKIITNKVNSQSTHDYT